MTDFTNIHDFGSRKRTLLPDKLRAVGMMMRSGMAGK